MINDSNDFANKLLNYGDKSETPFRMATVTSITNGLFLKFYGEESARVKSFKRLSSYTPKIGDVVICAKLNGSYTVLGKVV